MNTNFRTFDINSARELNADLPAPKRALYRYNTAPVELLRNFAIENACALFRVDEKET